MTNRNYTPDNPLASGKRINSNFAKVINKGAVVEYCKDGERQVIVRAVVSDPFYPVSGYGYVKFSSGELVPLDDSFQFYLVKAAPIQEPRGVGAIVSLTNSLWTHMIRVGGTCSTSIWVYPDGALVWRSWSELQETGAIGEVVYKGILYDDVRSMIDDLGK